jgi:hypothetical protein
MEIELTIQSNLKAVSDDMQASLQRLVDESSPYLLAGATGVLSLVLNRIHVEGKKADGTEIGQYANSYMQVREKNNRGEDRKIILSLTRQMENDFSPVETGDQVGLGFNSTTNFDKATWMEERFPGTYELSVEESDTLVAILEDIVNGVFE